MEFSEDHFDFSASTYDAVKIIDDLRFSPSIRVFWIYMDVNKRIVLSVLGSEHDMALVRTHNSR